MTRTGHAVFFCTIGSAPPQDAEERPAHPGGALSPLSAYPRLIRWASV